jgi:acyl-CoA thioester hydrolase
VIAHTSSFRVRYAETDQMRVVYHANYLVWLEVARTDLIRAHGIAYADLERQGIALTVAEASIRYQAPARYDDEIRVTAMLRDVRSRSLRIDYEVRRAADDQLLATAYTALVSIDTTTQRPVQLPKALQEVFARTAAANFSTVTAT